MRSRRLGKKTLRRSVSAPEIRVCQRETTGPQRQRIKDRDGWRCVFCAESSDLTVDHVVPLSRGGVNADLNLVCCCNACNAQKGSLLPWEFLIKRFGISQSTARHMDAALRCRISGKEYRRYPRDWAELRRMLGRGVD